MSSSMRFEVAVFNSGSKRLEFKTEHFSGASIISNASRTLRADMLKLTGKLSEANRFLCIGKSFEQHIDIQVFVHGFSSPFNHQGDDILREDEAL